MRWFFPAVAMAGAALGLAHAVPVWVAGPVVGTAILAARGKLGGEADARHAAQIAVPRKT